MNANIELAVITKVIDNRDFHTLERAKIDESYFFTPEAREAYRLIRDMYHHPGSAGDTPSRELLRSYFPSFPFWESTDTVAILAEQLRRSKISMEIQNFAQDLLLRVGVNPMDALATIENSAPRLAAFRTVSQDFSMSASLSSIRERYYMVKNAGGVIGIPYPWPPLNHATQGLRRQNYVVIYGRPKSMKTWIALKIAAHAYVEGRRRVLFYSREMSPIELQERIACIIAKVSYKDFMDGTLQPSSEERIWNVLDELADDERNYAVAMGTKLPYFIITTDSEAEDAAGVSWLRAKIEELDPDIALVDGMYLMKDDRSKTRSIDWKNITHISQDMKSAAKYFDIPIIGITQARRGAEKTRGEDLTELAFADAIGMDADAVFRIIKDVKLDPETKTAITEIMMTAPGLRSGVFEGMVLRAIPGHTFDVVREFTALDIHNKGHYEQADMAHQPTPVGRGGAPRLIDTSNRPFRRDGTFREPKIPIR